MKKQLIAENKFRKKDISETRNRVILRKKRRIKKESEILDFPKLKDVVETVSNNLENQESNQQIKFEHDFKIGDFVKWKNKESFTKNVNRFSCENFETIYYVKNIVISDWDELKKPRFILLPYRKNISSYNSSVYSIHNFKNEILFEKVTDEIIIKKKDFVFNNEVLKEYTLKSDFNSFSWENDELRFKFDLRVTDSSISCGVKQLYYINKFINFESFKNNFVDNTQDYFFKNVIFNITEEEFYNFCKKHLLYIFSNIKTGLLLISTNFTKNEDTFKKCSEILESFPFVSYKDTENPNTNNSIRMWICDIDQFKKYYS